MPEFQQFRLGEAINQGQTAALNNYRLGEAERGIQARQGLTQALQTGTPEAMTKYGQQFPQENMQYQKQKSDTRTSQIQEQLSNFEIAGRIMEGIKANPSSYTQVREMAGKSGMDVSQWPQNYDPNFIAQKEAEAIGIKGKLEEELKRSELGLKARSLTETERHNRAQEGISRDSSRGGGKPPAGYRYLSDGNLEPIPGGPATKPTDAQQKQLTGVTNLQNGINEYLGQLKTWGMTDIISPDARARMGTKYNNMMLQAKEAYNLGVLNGPDFEILQRVVTDPRTLTGAITSNKALGDQARELGRIMGAIGATAATGQVRDPNAKPEYHGKIQPKNNKGWILHEDAKGNKAYVGPNGEIEEVK